MGWMVMGKGKKGTVTGLILSSNKTNITKGHIRLTHWRKKEEDVAG